MSAIVVTDQEIMPDYFSAGAGRNWDEVRGNMEKRGYKYAIWCDGIVDINRHPLCKLEWIDSRLQPGEQVAIAIWNEGVAYEGKLHPFCNIAGARHY